MQKTFWLFSFLLGLLYSLPAQAGTPVKLHPLASSARCSSSTTNSAQAAEPQQVAASSPGTKALDLSTNDWTVPTFVAAPRSKATSSVKTLAKAVASTAHTAKADLAATSRAAKADLVAGKDALVHHLARLTAYWAGEGDFYTGRGVSATGIHLHGGHCAVDPKIIPYGSVVEIPGVGQFLAVDTGSAVIHRTAAREAGHTTAERGALVIDLYFEHRRDGVRFAAQGPKYASINWWTPNSTVHEAQAARGFFADENWNLIYNKQL